MVNVEHLQEGVAIINCIKIRLKDANAVHIFGKQLYLEWNVGGYGQGNVVFT